MPHTVTGTGDKVVCTTMYTCAETVCVQFGMPILYHNKCCPASPHQHTHTHTHTLDQRPFSWLLSHLDFLTLH
jgi:hypothetical protein